MAGAQGRLSLVQEGAASLFPVGQQRLISSSTSAADWLANESFAERWLPTPAPVPQVFAAAQLLESSEDESPSEDDSQEHGTAHIRHQGPVDKHTDTVNEGDGELHPEGMQQKHHPAKTLKPEGVEHEERSKHKRRRKHRSRKGDDASSEDSRARRHWKRRRKKEREKEKARAKAASVEQFQVPVGTERKAGVKTWVGDAPLTSEYYFDTTGDRDNLAFGSLYRLDVARYYRQSSHFVDRVGAKRSHFGTLQEPEADASARVAGEKRYWGPDQAHKERSTKFKRIKAAPAKGSSAPPGGFIPLSEAPPKPPTAEEGPVDEGESFEDSLLRRTREFNELTRTRPQELQGWLDFAAFQNEFQKLGKKKQTVQALDKKLAIYEKALDHHPDSDDLLLAYLTALSQRDDAPTLQAKWDKVLKRLSGSTLLWRGYIAYRKGQYSSFMVSDVRGVYAQAIGALVQERNRVRHEGSGEDKLLQAERELVRIFLDVCLFEWQTGHHELAIGLFQAQTEYSVFAPPVQASEVNKQKLFQQYWESGAPRIGERGALGWGTWLAKEETKLQNWNGGIADEHQEEEKGGWSGWQELKAIGGRGCESEAESEGGSESDSEGGREEEESDEALLKRLGVNLDAADLVDAADGDTWHKWALEEESRGERQWLPVRPKEDPDGSGVSDDDEDADGALQRTVLFDDIQPFLFSLGCEGAEQDLLAGFGAFCEAPVPPWTTSNDALVAEARETVTGSLRDSLERATPAEGDGNVTSASAGTDAVPGASENEVRIASGGEILTKLVGGPSWLDQDPPERRQFATDLLLRASGAFPASQSLAQALLRLASDGDVNGKEGRALAKALLKRRRDDLALWQTYAQLEAAAGRAAAARVVLVTTLNSLSGLPVAAREHAPALFLALAEMELRGMDGTEGMGAGSNGGRTQALHTLTCFGEGIDLTPLGGAEVPPSRILRAKNGYCDKLQQIRACSLRQLLTDADVATIGCAALFEDTSGGGWQAAAATYEDALNLGLPGRRVKSPQYERLVEKYVQTLTESGAKPSRQRQAIMRGLGSFPKNAELLSALVKGEAHQALANRLRRYFDAVGAKTPSIVGWLFAIASELGRPGARARIRSIFERALAAQETKQSVVLWRAYLAFELDAPANPSQPYDPSEAARRIFFRALHACPWSKMLWLDGIKKLTERGALTGKEVGDLCETMREKEMRIRTDIYEILLQEGETEQT